MATGRIGVTPTLGTRWSKAPSAGTTSLSGLDDSSVSLVYSVGYEQVYRNGVLLSRGNDYTATSGNSITLTDATVNGDIIEVFANELVPLTDAISKGQFTAKGSLLSASAASTPAVLAVGTNGQVLKADSSTSTGLIWGSAGSSFKGCRAVTNTNQLISNATYTVLNYNSETYDTDGFHSTSTNTGRMTIPAGLAGYYLLITQAVFDPNATGQRASKIQKNGADVSVGRKMAAYSSTVELTLVGSDIIYLAEGDYVEHLVYQSSGGNLYMAQDSTTFTGFTIQYLGA